MKNCLLSFAFMLNIFLLHAQTEDLEFLAIGDSKEDVIEKVEQEEPVFQVCEQMPQFSGGQAALMKYIGDNYTYPKNVPGCVQGKIVVRFVVRKDGSIGKIDVIRGLFKEYDEEAENYQGNA